MDASQIASLVASPVIAAVIGAAVAAVKTARGKSKSAEERFDREHRMLLDGMKALMRAELFDLHREYIQAGLPVPLEIKEQATSVYNVYSGLGGNGVGMHLWQELMEAHASESCK